MPTNSAEPASRRPCSPSRRWRSRWESPSTVRSRLDPVITTRDSAPFHSPIQLEYAHVALEPCRPQERGTSDKIGQSGVHLLVVLRHTTGTVVAQRDVATKSSEITGFEPRLSTVDLADAS